jgi:hypothetical protein
MDARSYKAAPHKPLIIPGFLPSTLRAALCAFKNVPDIFVVKSTAKSRSGQTRSRRGCPSNGIPAICPRFDRTFAAGLKGVKRVEKTNQRFQAGVEILIRRKK